MDSLSKMHTVGFIWKMIIAFVVVGDMAAVWISALKRLIIVELVVYERIIESVGATKLWIRIGPSKADTD